MLSQTKSSFETNVTEILEKSLYKAMMCFYQDGEDDDVNRVAKSHIEKACKTASETFSKEASKKLVGEIDKYIKSMGINISTSPADIKLYSAMGPVTGSITITPQTSEIKIT